MRGRKGGDNLRRVGRLGKVGLAASLALLVGCQGREVSGYLDDHIVDGGAADRFIFDDDFDPNKPPAPDAGGLCGNEIIPTLTEPPNLYFVIDRSGSMADIINGRSKYSSLETALVDLVRRMGSRARVGATLFPAYDANESCLTGEEVFKTTLGDPLSYAAAGENGPVTSGFAQAIHRKPRGGTPTGATLEDILPKLVKLEGDTYVILATDGGPNCNPKAQCSALTCIPNIEQLPNCQENLRNCCTPEAYGRINCLDSTRTLHAVEDLAQAGIKTYVIGLPGAAGDRGTEIYAWLLDPMAILGQTARNGTPKYFAVSQMSELREVLETIGAEIIATCDFTLAEAPEDPGMVNVYFDQEVVPQDPENGWDWTGPDSLSLRGEACRTVKSGAVLQVQIVVGCPTEQPK